MTVSVASGTLQGVHCCLGGESGFSCIDNFERDHKGSRPRTFGALIGTAHCPQRSIAICMVEFRGTPTVAPDIGIFIEQRWCSNWSEFTFR